MELKKSVTIGLLATNTTPNDWKDWIGGFLAFGKIPAGCTVVVYGEPVRRI